MNSPSDFTVDELCVLHVDLDAFFASVEVMDDPSLKGKPVAVGGAGDRGVIASASYEARSYGVFSAMPSVQARRLCPDLIIVPGHFKRYEEVSAHFRSLVEDLTPVVEPLGLDELFADLRSLRRLDVRPVPAARQLRERIRDEIGVGSGIGLGPNKLFAKLASKRAKPRVVDGRVTEGLGVVAVDTATRERWLDEMPIRALWGVGAKTADRLARVGLTMVRELGAVDEAILRHHVGPAMAAALKGYAVGEDSRPVQADRANKSIGSEETVPRSLTTRDEALVVLRKHAGIVARALRGSEQVTRTVSVHVRCDDLSQVGRRQTVDFGLDDDEALGHLVEALFDTLDIAGPMRLLGVSASGLTPRETATAQLSFDLRDGGSNAVAESRDRQIRREVLTDVVDDLRRRFGTSAVGVGRDFAAGVVDVREQRDRHAFGPDGESSTQRP